ncbi:uncharacterized protein N0V89_002323 [Didymosphaeria variabile]|uniref:Uncharacterized protein n=1 Tax=Didymosphaeria variabile TaxID=1932322 RepID=A0A9W8XRG0_9PLEO|nr:uncharacterized protein N0V89_002323 [Didymosphaeria variabile]KAJ4357747.1 hypothetical protein N0V89_002323 [Didymosphaeria variabile]
MSKIRRKATKKATLVLGTLRDGRRQETSGTSYYSVVGRVLLDIIKSGGYRISALDVERELLALRYIPEATVVDVSDEKIGQRVAAHVSLQDKKLTDAFLESHGNKERVLTIAGLCNDPRPRLVGCKVPTLLLCIVMCKRRGVNPDSVEQVDESGGRCKERVLVRPRSLRDRQYQTQTYETFVAKIVNEEPPQMTGTVTVGCGAWDSCVPRSAVLHRAPTVLLRA